MYMYIVQALLLLLLLLLLYRFMTQNTVEAVISIVQDKKLKLATDVLEG